MRQDRVMRIAVAGDPGDRVHGQTTTTSAVPSDVVALLPNLPDLLVALPSSPAGRDAAELAEAAGAAMTPDDVDDALDLVIAQWATP